MMTNFKNNSLILVAIISFSVPIECFSGENPKNIKEGSEEYFDQLFSEESKKNTSQELNTINNSIDIDVFLKKLEQNRKKKSLKKNLQFFLIFIFSILFNCLPWFIIRRLKKWLHFSKLEVAVVGFLFNCLILMGLTECFLN